MSTLHSNHFNRTNHATASLSTIGLAALLVSVALLPSLVRYLVWGSSLAVGTAVVALFAITMYLVNWSLSMPEHWRSGGYVDAGFMALIALVVLAVIPHGAIASLWSLPVVGRMLSSVGMLLLLIVGGVALGGVLAHASDSDVDRSLRFAFGALCVVALLGIAGIQPLAERGFTKPMFPFTEPSHFALDFIPLLLYRCARAKRRAAWGWVFFGIVLALAVQNLTLMVGCILAAVVARRLMVVSAMGVLAAFAAVPLGLAYFVERLDFSGDVENLSALIYIQGWQLIGEALANSSGWGIGFQQLGVNGTQVPIASVILEMAGIYLGLLDGGFMFAKLTAEFGVFGFGAICVYFLIVLRSLVALRRGACNAASTWAHCVVVAYTVDLMVRGTGYFSGTNLMLIACLSLLAANGQVTQTVVRALRTHRRASRSLQTDSL